MILPTKKIAIVLLSLTTISLAAYYYITYIKPTSEESIHSNWLYRKSLDITNDEGIPLAEQDILIAINTKELIDSKKLKNDCSDLRFVDEDNFTNLRYWIEGGCNSEETEIWVRIPLIEPQGKSIYMYYGNELAEDMQENWEGEFIIQRETPCTESWTEQNIFYGKYIKGSSIYGIEEGSRIHTHTIKTDTRSCNEKAYIVTEGESSCSSGILSKSLSYYATTSLPSLETYYCSNNNGLLENGSFAMLDTNIELQGWTSVEETLDRFAVGIDKDSKGENSLNNNISICKTNPTGDVNDNYILKSFSISSSSNIPAYYKIKYIKNTDKTFFPSNSIGIFTKLPPLGWEYYTKLEGLIPLGASKELGEKGGETEYTDTLKLYFEKESNSYSSEEYLCLENKQKTLVISGSNFPETVSVIFAKKKSSLKISLSSESAVFEKENKNITEEGEEIKKDTITQKGTEIKENGTVLGIVAPDQPTELLTDGRTNPSYILSSNPSFSAIYTDPDEDNSSAYQIEVNTASNFSGTIKWDSGKISTTISHNSRSSDITYSGTPLTNSKSTLYWRIRFWDIDDDVSDWSETATFVDLYNYTKMEGIRLKGININ